MEPIGIFLKTFLTCTFMLPCPCVYDRIRRSIAKQLQKCKEDPQMFIEMLSNPIQGQTVAISMNI